MATKMIQVKHITNSLYQMETWARYLRLALYKMDPAMTVSTEDDVPQLRKPPILVSGCPPAPPDHRRKKAGKAVGKKKVAKK